MIKVLNIIEEGRGGGPLSRIKIVAQKLAGNVDTIVIAPESAQEYHNQLKQAGVRSVPTPLHYLTKATAGLISYILTFRGEIAVLKKLIQKEQPAAVHVNGAYQIKGLLAARRTKVPCIWHMNDMYQPSSVQWVFKRLSGLTDHFIFASEGTREYYESISPQIKSKQNIVIPAPVDTKKFQPRLGSGISRNKPFDIATIGYINDHKGLEYLIDAARQVQDLNVRFHIVGPILETQARYGKRLKSDSKNLSNILWHGFKSNTATFLKDMDLYACSSIREASPMAVWEAMASGLPIVSTDVGDVQKIFSQYDCGIVVPTHDGTSLANAIRKLCTIDKDTLRQKGANARKAAETLMSLQVVSDQYLEFLREITSE